MPPRKRARFVLDPQSYELIYGEECRAAVARLVDLVPGPLSAGQVAREPALLADVEVILSGWGPPVMDAAFLEAATALEAVFYGAGSVRKFVSDELWERGVVVSSAAGLNAVPVAEFTLAQIIFATKRVWRHALDVTRHGVDTRGEAASNAGLYRAVVGVVSLGAIGRRVCALLRHFDVEVLAYDPHCSAAEMVRLGARCVGLDELFARSDVVSLHTPDLPATQGMITARLLAALPRDATFINTARGDVVREGELADVLARRPDLWAVLDVLAERDRSARARLMALPNVMITPHLAGSQGRECRRMGLAMVDELAAWLDGRPLRWQVTGAQMGILA